MFQPGNSYGQSRRTVENVLRRAAHRSHAALDRACMRVIEDAADHESPTHRLACLQFIADRLDGKARQSIEVTGDHPREVELSELVRLVLAARTADATDAAPITSEPQSQSVIPHSGDPA